MEKPKKEATSSSNRHLWGCLGFVFFVCFGLFGFSVVISQHFWGRIPPTTLSSELVPTAESLLDIPRSVHVSGGTGFYLDVMDTNAICVRAGYINESKDDIVSFSSNLFIDGQWIVGASYTYVDDLLDISANLNWCATGELQPGIHLIEFQLKDSFWGEPIHIQQWAIEID